MTELVVLVVVLVLATAFGLWRRATDGRLSSIPTDPADSVARPGTADGVQAGDGEPNAAGDRPPPADGNPVADRVTAVLGPDDLGRPLGDQATLVQFSSAFCTPCRATRVVLTEVAAMVPGVVHVEVDAEAHLELVRRLDVTRTPTVLVLDSGGRIRSRATGAPRKADVIAALGQVV